MPNFFQAIGQSNLQDTMRNLTNTALNIRQMQNQEQHMRALEGVQNQRLEIEQQAAGREQKQFEYQQQELAKKQKWAQTYTPASLVAPNIHSLPNIKALYIKTAKEAGYDVREMDDDVYMPNEAYQYLSQLTSQRNEFGKQALNATLTDLQTQNAAISQQIAQMQQGGKSDTKVLAQLQKQQMAIKQQIASVIGADAELQKKLMMEQERQEGRIGLEGERFENRAALKSIPQAKASGPRTGRGGPGGGGGKPTKAFSATYVATLPDGQEINAQKFQNGVFADMQGNQLPAGSRVISTVGSKSLKRRLGGGQPSNATQSSSPASQSQPLWKKYQ